MGTDPPNARWHHHLSVAPYPRFSCSKQTGYSTPDLRSLPILHRSRSHSSSITMQWFTLLAIPLVAITAWLYTVNIARSRFPKLRNKRICLLIAHPDDEAMFFAPTLLALTSPDLGNHVKILCLSSGDADGLGETRKKELVKSGMALGLRKEDDVFVVESPDFPDSMTTAWDKQKIATLLSSAFAPNLISLFHGARHFISSLIHNRPGWGSPVDLYSLSTVNVVRKYTSFFDSIISLVVIIASKKQMNEHPSPLLFLSGVQEVRAAQTAMTSVHKSQMR